MSPALRFLRAAAWPCIFCPDSRRTAVGTPEPEPEPELAPRWDGVGVRLPSHGDQVSILLATPPEGSDEMPAGREYAFMLGDGSALAGIEEMVMGLAPGHTVERTVVWPADFPDPAHRHQAKRLRVTLMSVHWFGELPAPVAASVTERLKRTRANPYWQLKGADIAPDVLAALRNRQGRGDPSRLIAAAIQPSESLADVDGYTFSVAMAFHERQRARRAA